jgi:hypothetical protein
MLTPFSLINVSCREFGCGAAGVKLPHHASSTIGLILRELEADLKETSSLKALYLANIKWQQA